MGDTVTIFFAVMTICKQDDLNLFLKSKIIGKKNLELQLTQTQSYYLKQELSFLQYI